MFRLIIAFITILFEMVGISFLRAAAKPVPKPSYRHTSIIVPHSPVRAEDESEDELIAA
jgi:hypothetical protein